MFPPTIHACNWMRFIGGGRTWNVCEMYFFAESVEPDDRKFENEIIWTCTCVCRFVKLDIQRRRREWGSFSRAVGLVLQYKLNFFSQVLLHRPLLLLNVFILFREVRAHLFASSWCTSCWAGRRGVRPCIVEEPILTRSILSKVLKMSKESSGYAAQFNKIQRQQVFGHERFPGTGTWNVFMSENFGALHGSDYVTVSFGTARNFHGITYGTRSRL